MATSINWATPAEGGYMYADELSDYLRVALQPLTKFRQFAEPDEGSIDKGLHAGATYTWNVYGDVATQGRQLTENNPMPETSFTVGQSSLTVTEFGNSVPSTQKVTALARHDVEKIIDKALKNDARKALDIATWEQFNACQLRVASATSASSVTLTTNASTVTTNNIALGSGHIKAIADIMQERDIPGFYEDDYVCLSHPTTLRTFKNELETLNQYTDQGIARIANGEVGRYEGFRFVHQNFIPKGGAIDTTTFDPYTKTADAWNNGLSSWAFFFGGDTINEAMVIPEEIRAKMPGDFGRSKGLAWYYLGGFGIVHTAAAQSRIVKWDSAA